MLLAAVTAAGLLPLAACGAGGTTAATMHLRRTEGTVSVSDGDGKDLPALDNLGLYSGYGVGTRPASYAWIDLDDVKLAKLDQNSEIAIRKEGKALDIEVKSGSLFFNVTEPLSDDETLNIRTSTMLVGIRGTCGWVEDNDGLSRVYLLEGKVECGAEGQTVRVNAGEMAELTGDGDLTVKEFPKQDLPTFVRDEVDPGLFGGESEPPGPEPAETPEPPESSDTPEPTAEPAEGVTWSLDNGILTIGGTGPLDSVPWSDDRDQVHTVIIGGGVTGIGRELFKNHSNLERITISGSVTSIGFEAFYGCRSLTEVIMLEGVASIGDSAFCDCSGLITAIIPESVTSIGYQAFRNCGNLINVTIPNGVASIGRSAFMSCGSLERVTIPGSVTELGAEVFSSCSGLISATIEDGVPYIPNHAFGGCSSLERVTVPGSVTSIGFEAFYGCRGLTEATILEGVASIGDSAFCNCSSLITVIIPEGVTSIGTQAFRNCSSLTGITIPTSVASIGGYAFKDCHSLEYVTIPDGITGIGSETFYNCGSLPAITIPGSVTSIGYGAFRGCRSLAEVYYGGSESQGGEISFGSSNDPLLNAGVHCNGAAD